MRNNDKLKLPETGFVRIDQILKFIPVGKSTWWAGVKSGRFPQGIKIGPQTRAWKVRDIQDLIDRLEQSGKL